MSKTITYRQRLKATRKAARETTHTVKPMVTQDKKKVANKRMCRKKIVPE